jgi:hypothetical protein
VQLTAAEYLTVSSRYFDAMTVRMRLVAGAVSSATPTRSVRNQWSSWAAARQNGCGRGKARSEKRRRLVLAGRLGSAAICVQERPDSFGPGSSQR